MHKKCQIFTPVNYVQTLLDCVGYKNNLYGKKIMENSCGDGNILTVIVQRYIDDCRSKGLSSTKIKNGLNKDIYGMEIDPIQYNRCIENLNKVLINNNIKNVKWNIFNDDYLRFKDIIKYDYVVGNPPYITYSELELSEKSFLNMNFTSCKKGKFDYCYAFIEKSINSLSNTGKMAYLIPSSIYKTVYGNALRQIMLPVTKKIIDYQLGNIFKGTLVKSSIIVIDKTNSTNTIHYIDDTTNTDKLIVRESLGRKWFFGQPNLGNKRFGDYFKVSHVIATLYNKAYIINDWSEDDTGRIICGNFVLEPEVIRDAVSPQIERLEVKEKIIFPYTYTSSHELIRYSDKEFSLLYPGTYKYLKQYKNELDKRDRDNNALWFEYGRSQALNHLDCEKALISTIISSKVIVYKLDQKTIPYAGMYITAISNEMTIDDAIEILKKDTFFNYVKNVGIPINGNSVRVTSKDIENYMFN